MRASASGLRPLIVDVTDANSIAAAAAEVNEVTGGRLAGLVNNAGIALSGPIEGLDLDELRRQFEVNVFGQVAVTQALLPSIRASKGRIVFMSSVGEGSPPLHRPLQRLQARARGDGRFAAPRDAAFRRRGFDH